ncbi:expressed unknown protein [Seminavis robusta]|uniref:CENP-V/GFA domain-containing protein n=1 Tax=Seminavis robusta TaxID=568900 RepID=A0A9N8E8M1_9STRA|nr:expressed unknown protein [Seminavis robusta]|eukprot:Sro669_g184470.1 n/a (221) ;mRNA; f:8051-8713
MTGAAEPGRTSTSMLFKCKCESVQFELSGEPLLDGNCHCHSCVACCRYVDEKHNKGGGTTGIVNHGAAFTFFKPDQLVKYTVADSVKREDNNNNGVLGAVKVGDSGKNMRLFTTCCGTMVGFALPKMIGLNRNCITVVNDNDNNNDPYQPADPIMNWRKNDAFDPSIVPEPSHKMVPISTMFSFMMPMMNPFGPKFDPKDENQKMFFPELDKAEIVEITW